jgi:hypothetical protein
MNSTRNSTDKNIRNINNITQQAKYMTIVKMINAMEEKQYKQRKIIAINAHLYVSVYTLRDLYIQMEIMVLKNIVIELQIH